MLVFLIHFHSDIHAVTMLDYAFGMCGFVIISDCQQQILHSNKGGRYNLKFLSHFFFFIFALAVSH